mmetsp:Transcript_2340/g.3281  ORF Transcript_2340/g.3281 Transcript_2340/m.3281 type:complete len:410 (+) Transcript_2340:34-1263(+)
MSLNFRDLLMIVTLKFIAIVFLIFLTVNVHCNSWNESNEYVNNTQRWLSQYFHPVEGKFNLESLPPAEAEKYWVMFNRLPKAASSTSMAYLKTCQTKSLNHNATVWTLINNHYSETSRHGLMGNSKRTILQLRDKLSSNKYVLVMQHSYHTNFTILESYAGNGIIQPQYVNIYRDPLTQSASHFDYLVSSTRARGVASGVAHEKELRRKAGPCGCADLSHRECVLTAASRGCENVNYYLRGETLHYMCGWQSAVCAKDTHGKEAYELARDHLYTYVFVGLSEHYTLSISIFKDLYPQFFCENPRLQNSHTYSTKRDHGEDYDMDYRRLIASFEGNKWDFKLHLHVVCLFWLRVHSGGHDYSTETKTSADNLVLKQLDLHQDDSCQWVEYFPHPFEYTQDQQRTLWPFVP